jgi:hypothetical protein
MLPSFLTMSNTWLNNIVPIPCLLYAERQPSVIIYSLRWSPSASTRQQTPPTTTSLKYASFNNDDIKLNYFTVPSLAKLPNSNMSV